MDEKIDNVFNALEKKEGKFDEDKADKIKEQIGFILDEGYNKDFILGVGSGKFDFLEKKIKERRAEKRITIEDDEDVYNVDYNSDGEIIKKKLCYAKLAEKILNKLPIITLREGDSMFFYKGGVWLNSPASYITEMAKEYTEDEITTHQLNEALLQIRSMTYIDGDAFDASPHELNCKNGIYNLITGEFGSHTKEKYIISQIPVEYDENADCPHIKQFLSEILREKDIPTIQKLLGYCLVRHYKFHKIFMFVGLGANGKSTLLDLVRVFLGEDNVSSIALQEFERNRFSKLALMGKLANVFADLTDKAMYNTGIFKILTGEDTISAEKKFGGFTTFKNYAKLIFSMNRAPRFTEDTIAIWRRICIMEFPNQFLGDDADKDLLIKLTTPEELSGLLNWAIEGYKQLEVEGFGEDSIVDVRKKYRLISDSLGSFIEARVEEESDKTIPKEEFYEAYVKWCKENDAVVKAKNVVGRELQEHLPSVRSGQESVIHLGQKYRMSIYRGIMFKEEEKDQTVENDDKDNDNTSSLAGVAVFKHGD